MKSLSDIISILSFADNLANSSADIKGTYGTIYKQHLALNINIQKSMCQMICDSLLELLCVTGRCSAEDFDLDFDEEIVVSEDGSCSAIDFLLLKGATFKKEIIIAVEDRDPKISTALIEYYCK